MIEIFHGDIMPTYDYKCTNCGYAFEHFQSMMDEPLSECPICKGFVKRLISAGLGPVFKGTGFYETDYKNKSSNGNATKPRTPVVDSINKEK